MKKIRYSILILTLLFAFASCDEFLTTEPSDSVIDETAFKTAKDVTNGLNGLYYQLGRYEFYGRNVIALGDIAADNCWMTGSSGHYDQIYKYTAGEDNADLLDIWDGGYKVINSAAKLITAAKTMLEGDLSDSGRSQVKSAIAQAYGIKALSQFALVNIFGLPYSDANKSALGIVIVGDNPIVAFQTVERSTVEAVYNQILSDIENAKTDIGLVGFDAFLMNEASLYALEARVKLYKKDYEGAIISANSAITKSGGSLVMSSTAYASMWSSIALTSEDIFTICKTSDDNLSANSLNTLYGSYNGKATSGLLGLFSSNDMRLALFSGSGEMIDALKYQGIPSSAATSNIPVLRLPEMYLIIAEAKAQLGQEDAVDYIFDIAQRNQDLLKSDVPKEKNALLNFIYLERRRELFQEGHRWFDLRRTGEIMTRVGGNYSISNWDASKFVYPIPSQEVNASGIAQNTGWTDNLPK